MPEEEIEKALAERRSLEQALADLRASFARRPSVGLARMIQQLEAEIAARQSRNDEA
jgi:hypothetical protein